MKLFKKLFVIMCFVLLLCGCGNKTYHEINYKEFQNLMDSKKNFVLFIGSETCSACQTYKVTLNKVIKEYNLDVKYIDLNKLTSEEESKIISMFSVTGTPTTVFLTKGKEENNYNRIVGNAKYSKIVNKFKQNGYIKE